MNLEDLSLKELLLLSRQAEEMCLRRFDQIHQGSDPTDLPLHDLLRELSAEGQNHARAVDEYHARLEYPEIVSLRPTDAERLVLWRLPSIVRKFGEGLLDRDLALFFAESLEEEATRFYHALSEHAPDGESRSFFTNMAERDRCSLDLLRQVVLQG
jgi:rubrerythrin